MCRGLKYLRSPTIWGKGGKVQNLRREARRQKDLRMHCLHRDTYILPSGWLSKAL